MWPQAASRSPSADKPRTQPHRLSLDKQQLAHQDRKSGFQEKKAGQRPALRTSPETGQRSPIPPAPSAGEGSESPSVVSGAGRAAYGLSFLHPCRERGRSKGIKGSLRRDPHPFGARPYRAALRVRLPVAPLTPFPLKTAKHAIRKRPSSPQGPFPGFGIPKAPPSRENVLRAVFEPLAERRAGQGPQGWLARPAAKRGHGPPRRAKRTLDATNATPACTRGGRDEGRSPPPLPPELPGGEGGVCRGAAPLCPSPQGAEQVAPESVIDASSQRPTGRKVPPIWRSSTLRKPLVYRIVYSYNIVSIRNTVIRYERRKDHGTSRHHSGSSFYRR